MRVGVIGAGFAGLAAAISFQRLGHDVTVFERGDAPSTAGGAIVLARNALTCLRMLHIGECEIATDRSDTPATVRRPDGRVLVRSTLSKLTGGGLVATVPRTEVLDRLLAELPSTCIRFSAPVRDVDPDGTICSDAHASRYDLVVAADGVRSVARRTLWPSAPQPRFTGIAGWAWIADEHLSAGFGTIWGASADFGILPLTDGRTYVYGGAPRGAELHQFSDWADPLPALINAARRERTITPDIYEVRPPTQLVRGKVVLVGDAAHASRPTFGQGAALAMEDAITLARGGLDGLARRRSRMFAMYYAAKFGSRFATPGLATIGTIRNGILQLTPDPLFELMAGAVSRWRPPTDQSASSWA